MIDIFHITQNTESATYTRYKLKEKAILEKIKAKQNTVLEIKAKQYAVVRN